LTIDVVDRTTKTINYRSRSGSTKIDFRGTPLLPAAKGEAKVESRQGYVKVQAKFDKLLPATRFGPEYLTYVLWAITPEGRATNMGEVILDGMKSKLDVTTELQAFGMVVTAEPYFAVSQPSDVVVMDNVVRDDTVGKVGAIEAKYQLLKRGQYTFNVLPTDLKPMDSDRTIPLDLQEARNAVRIASWAGAESSAAESFQRARTLLVQAETYQSQKASSRLITMTAREAVQTAEDSRLLTMNNQAAVRLSQERVASRNREAAANAAAVAARDDSRQAERNRAMAQLQAEARLSEERAASAAREGTANRAAAAARAAVNEAERARVVSQVQADLRLAEEQAASAAAARAAANDAERIRMAQQAQASARLTDEKAASAQREAAANQAAAAAAKAAAETTERNRAIQAAEVNRVRLDAERATRRDAEDAKAQAERNRLDELSAAQRAARSREAAEAADRQTAKAASERTERERQELRTQLIGQLNSILETKDSARGLVVNMSDVLFETGQYSLKPGARERLAKVSGIVLAHPSLVLRVEGHTDSVGADDENQRLSERRAHAVGDFLISQGIAKAAVSTYGYGESQPLATNDTVGGRQQNRRVDLVVSGEAIAAQSQK
jgi:outer membrane protein OmpA-like peptidoglycan-associated protein